MDISRDPSSPLFFNDSNIHFLRQMVQDLYEKCEYESVLFWADKVVDLGGELYSDLLVKLRCMFHLKEYQRCVFIIDLKRLDQDCLAFRHLKAKCLFEAKEYKEAFETISKFESQEEKVDGERIPGDDSVIVTTEVTVNPKNDIVLSTHQVMQWKSSLVLLKGHIYYASSSNASIAAECYRRALKLNPFNHEAFDCLTRHQMLSLKEEEQLLQDVLVIEPQKAYPLTDLSLTKYLYSTLIAKYSTSTQEHVLSIKLKDNLDVMTSEAERFFLSCLDDHKAYQVSQVVLSRDELHPKCLIVHLSCLLSLKKRIELFKLAHKLMAIYPERGVSWHSVACYYLSSFKSDSGRRYLSKALSLDSKTPWLLYGHSFACESEDDQAMAAYLKACHLMRGCHLSFLYIAMQSDKLTAFLKEALNISHGQDPLVYNELAVMSYNKGDYEAAEQHLNNAFKNNKILSDKLEPLLNNLGHVNRKLKRYDQACHYHRKALNILPDNQSTLDNIAFVYALQGKWNQAIEFFHKSLSIKRDHPFATNMLGRCIDHLVNPAIRSLEPPKYDSSHSTRLSSIIPIAAELPVQPTHDLSNDVDMEGQEDVHE